MDSCAIQRMIHAPQHGTEQESRPHCENEVPELRMRTPREITFRLKQELRNLELLAFPPHCRASAVCPLRGLPDPHSVAVKLSKTDFAAHVLETADQIVSHRFPLLGLTIDTGAEIEWRKDHIHQLCTGTQYFRRIPYLDGKRAGDHKNIWELNRHQHLVLLAQAYLFSERSVYLDEILAQLDSWWRQNPYQRGINWTSALEVAFRAFSWIWLYHLAGSKMPEQFRRRFLDSLYQHGRHLENNLSFYFSPNTHLLGEAVVLHALGQLFPSFPRAKKWVEIGGATVLEQMKRQVQGDGSHFEQSTYYHVYALDMFLFHAIVSKASREYLDTLARMADFLHAVIGPERLLPFLGDDDGGRWFHPYGPREEFARATLATCCALLGRQDWSYCKEDLYPEAEWWLGHAEGSGRGRYESRLFANCGLAVLESSSGRVIMDAGPFGPGRAGHSHSDSLSVIASANARAILVDSGTFTYVGDPQLRDVFRGSAAHNTIRVDGRNQATAIGPFWWADPPSVHIVSSKFAADQDEIVAECRYAEIVHRRLLRFVKPDLVFILDWINGSGKEHTIEQLWHLGSHEVQSHVWLGSAAHEIDCWHSPVFGRKERAHCLAVRREAGLPSGFGAALTLNEEARVKVSEGVDFVKFETSDGRKFEIDWPKTL